MAPLWQREAGLILQPGTWAAQPSLVLSRAAAPLHLSMLCDQILSMLHLISNILLFCSTYSLDLEIILSCLHGKGDKPMVWGHQELPYSKSKHFLLGSQNSLLWINFSLFRLDCLTTVKEPSKKYQKCKDTKTTKKKKKNSAQIQETAQWKLAQLFTGLDETLQLTHYILCSQIGIFLTIRRYSSAFKVWNGKAFTWIKY